MKTIELFATTLFFSGSVVAIASPCTEGANGDYILLRSCQASNVSDAVSGGMFARVDVCLSMIEKDGGPWGGDKIPWFYSQFNVIKANGEKQIFRFHAPDGRHNFRSNIDYSVIDFSDESFLMESHRTIYPDNSRKGTIDLHVVDFNFESKELTFEYTKRSGVVFGNWKPQMSFKGICN